MSTAGLIVEELDVEHIVAQPLHEGDLIQRCREHMDRIRVLLAQSQALRGAVAG